MGFDDVMPPTPPLTFAAETTGDYSQIEFRSGDRLLGVAGKSPFRLEGIGLDRGRLR